VRHALLVFLILVADPVLSVADMVGIWTGEATLTTDTDTYLCRSYHASINGDFSNGQGVFRYFSYYNLCRGPQGIFIDAPELKVNGSDLMLENKKVGTLSMTKAKFELPRKAGGTVQIEIQEKSDGLSVTEVFTDASGSSQKVTGVLTRKR
jgi:hypothetical protein